MLANIFNAEYIKEVGFPIAAFVAVFGIISTIIILIVKSQIKRQEICDTQYFKNVNNTLNNINERLTDVLVELRTVSTKIDQCFDNKSVTYIFKEGKIDKIKNIIEKKDVIRDIEKKI